MKKKDADSEQKPLDQVESRRHFLRCSGGATAAAVAAWQLLSQDARAGGGGGAGGSSGGGYGAISIGTLGGGSGS